LDGGGEIEGREVGREGGARARKNVELVEGRERGEREMSNKRLFVV